MYTLGILLLWYYPTLIGLQPLEINKSGDMVVHEVSRTYLPTLRNLLAVTVCWWEMT